MNVLFVCLGNICRSPLAAGIMSAIYAETGICGTIESAGTIDWNLSKPADPRSVKVALASGIDIRHHRARTICVDDFDRFDLIVVMDRENERAVRAMAPPEAQSKIRRIRSAPDNSHEADVPDPYHGNESHFRHVFEILSERCRDLADEISRTNRDFERT